MEHHVYWLLKSFCFELFGDGKYGLSYAKNWWKDDTCHFLAFHDIPGLGNIFFGAVYSYIVRS